MVAPVTKVVRSEGFFHGRLLQSYERAKRVVEQSILGERQILPLFGPSRIGKLEIAQALMADFPNQKINGGICKPLIRVASPPEPNQRSLTLSIIRGMEGRVLSKSNTSVNCGSWVSVPLSLMKSSTSPNMAVCRKSDQPLIF